MLILAAFTILFGVMPWIGLDMMDDYCRTFFEHMISNGIFKGGA
jgi:hypothetical protein